MSSRPFNKQSRRTGSIEHQSALARSILLDHTICAVLIVLFVGMQLGIAPDRDRTSR